MEGEDLRGRGNKDTEKVVSREAPWKSATLRLFDMQEFFLCKLSLLFGQKMLHVEYLAKKDHKFAKQGDLNMCHLLPIPSAWNTSKECAHTGWRWLSQQQLTTI